VQRLTQTPADRIQASGRRPRRLAPEPPRLSDEVVSSPAGAGRPGCRAGLPRGSCAQAPGARAGRDPDEPDAWHIPTPGRDREAWRVQASPDAAAAPDDPSAVPWTAPSAGPWGAPRGARPVGGPVPRLEPDGPAAHWAAFSRAPPDRRGGRGRRRRA